MALDGWKERLFRRYLFWACRPARVRKILPRPGAAPAARHFHKNRIRAAALQLELKLFRNPMDYVEEMHRRVKEAVAEGAQLVAFPEMNNLQLLGMLPGIEQAAEAAVPNPEAAGGKAQGDDGITLADVIFYVGPVMEPLLKTTFSTLAAVYGLYIMAGSFLLPDGEKMVNRAMLFGPSGELIGTQDKVHWTLPEKEWGLTRGRRFNLFDTAVGKLAMPVCMDATYFETFRLLERRGAEVVIIPIANPEPYNYWLALRGIWPRVQESPVYGIKSALVGRLLGFELTGRAGIFAPLELTPDGSGVLAEVEPFDGEGMAVAELDLEALRQLRADHPWRDSNEALYRRYFPGIYKNVDQTECCEQR